MLCRYHVGSPVLHSISPSHGPTAGGTLLTISGADFGTGAVTVMIGNFTVEFVVQVTPSVVRCYLPQGYGQGLAVVVSTAHQTSATSATSAVVFSYDPPVITALSVPGVPVAAGGFLLTIIGSGFSDAPTVTVGGAACPVVSVSPLHTSVSCTAPPRTAEVMPVVVSVATMAPVESPYPLLYAGPQITTLVPNVVPAVLGGVIEVRGHNFGAVPPGDEPGSSGRLSMRFHDRLCLPTWVSDSRIYCTLPGGLVAGLVNVSVTVWNETAHAPYPLVSRCDPGFYGGAGGLCVPCPDGATCEGGGAPPFPLPGYFRTDTSSVEFLRCQPESACKGGTDSEAQCADGYTGVPCSACEVGYYRLDQLCVPCHSTAGLFLASYFVGIVCLVGLFLYLQSKKMNLAALAMGLVRALCAVKLPGSSGSHGDVCGRVGVPQDFLQVLAMFGSFQIRWPEALQTLFTSASASNYNMELAAPECSLDVPFKTKWLAMQALPAVYLLVLCTFAAAMLCTSWVKQLGSAPHSRQRRKHRAAVQTWVDTVVGFSISGMYTLYFGESCSAQLPAVPPASVTVVAWVSCHVQSPSDSASRCLTALRTRMVCPRWTWNRASSAGLSKAITLCSSLPAS